MTLVCAECGTTEARTYVVTFTTTNQSPQGRTEVCMPCHEVIQ